MPLTITEFLEARITEDEADAINRVVLRSEDRRSLTGDDAEKMHAECAAKRAIISHYADTVKWAGDPDCPDVQSYSDIAVGLGESLRHLAAVYADHPGYQQGWAL